MQNMATEARMIRIAPMAIPTPRPILAPSDSPVAAAAVLVEEEDAAAPWVPVSAPVPVDALLLLVEPVGRRG